MNKTTLSFIMVLGLCTGFATTVMASEDDTYMDWSYASGLEPKPRPSEMVQETVVEENTPDSADVDELVDAQSNGDWQYAADASFSQYGNRQVSDSTQTTQYTSTQLIDIQAQNGMYQNATAQGNMQGGMGAGQNGAAGGAGIASIQAAQPMYRQVPMSAIQTPAQVQYVTNPIKVQYPVMKQYPISVQYPVTIQKDITVQRPVVVQQPIVVQRPIVMQQPVMVKQQPVMVHQQPVMVQQQPTIVQKQPIVVPVKTVAQMPCAAQTPCGNVRTFPFSGTTVTTTGITGTAVQSSFTYPAGMPTGF